MSASHLLHARIGAAPSPDCGPMPSVAPCWLCGAVGATRGMARADWNGASFTGQNRVRVPSSDWVCEPCVYFCARLSPVPGRPPKEGKSLGGNFRNYSHALDDRGYLNWSKGEKPGLLAWLRGPKQGVWFCGIAESGQKHTIPWIPVNPAGARGRVLFEEREIALPGARGWRLVDDLAALLTAGATKEEVGRGDYGPRAWQLCEALIRDFEEAHGSHRGGAWFALALYLSQRDEEAVSERMTAEATAKEAKRETDRLRTADHAKRNGHGAPRRAKDGTAKRSKPTQTVGPVANPDAGGGADHGERARVVDEVPARPANRGARQGAFAFD